MLIPQPLAVLCLAPVPLFCVSSCSCLHSSVRHSSSRANTRSHLPFLSSQCLELCAGPRPCKASTELLAEVTLIMEVGFGCSISNSLCFMDCSLPWRETTGGNEILSLRAGTLHICVYVEAVEYLHARELSSHSCHGRRLSWAGAGPNDTWLARERQEL